MLCRNQGPLMGPCLCDHMGESSIQGCEVRGQVHQQWWPRTRIVAYVQACFLQHLPDCTAGYALTCRQGMGVCGRTGGYTEGGWQVQG